jgi:hypothetical protein
MGARSFAIRHVEKFAEPEFTRLSRVVFADIQQTSQQLAETLEAESAITVPVNQAQSPMYRLGAYCGDELVGWSCGWMERGRVFYMAHSGVVPSRRRQGIYSSLLAGIRRHAQSNGSVAIRSQHSVLNNPVIIAKLQVGFNISGLSQSAQMGTLVEMTCHLSPQRHDLFRVRSLPYVAPEA